MDMLRELKRRQEEGFEELNKRIEAPKRPKLSITTYRSAGAHLIRTTHIATPDNFLNILASSVPSDVLQLKHSWNACSKEEDLQVINAPPPSDYLLKI